MRHMRPHPPGSRLRAGLIAGLLLAGTAGAPAAGLAGVVGQTGVAGQAHRSPEAVLDSILTSPPLDRAHWGIAIRDAAGGQPVLRHDAHRLFTAASTMKLVTAAAALDLLGPDHRFETVVDVTIDEAGRAGGIIVRGEGDPSLGDAFHTDPLAPLDSLADSLAAAGLRRVAGPVIVDQSRFDSVLVHPAWETFDLDWYYAAPVAPFAVMGGAYEVVVTPRAVGEPARVELPYAAELVAVDAGIRTVAGGDNWDDVLHRAADTDSLVLRGTIGVAAGPDTSWIAQTDPGRLGGRAFRHALERAGIAVDGPVVVSYTADAVDSPAGSAPRNVARAAGSGAAGARSARERVVWRSPPLEAIIRVALEQSDNWVTEQVLKAMAAALLGRGDWSSGTGLAEEYLSERVGVPAAAVYMRDGSGLSPQGLLSPDAVAALLRYAAGRTWGPAFRAALASPGEIESTLEDRLLPYRDRVDAKTGTLRHVNALSGYIRTRGERELVFSIVSNGSGRPSRESQAAIDRIVESLIESES